MDGWPLARRTLLLLLGLGMAGTLGVLWRTFGDEFLGRGSDDDAVPEPAEPDVEL